MNQDRIDGQCRLLSFVFVFALLGPSIAVGQCPPFPVIHTGEATFYTFANGGGACMFDPTPNDLMVGAMNATDYENSQVCGECVSLTGPNGTILIRIVDLCPGCKQGDIDLSPQAFSRIADTSRGRVSITWEVVPCGVTGPILYHFKDGSSRWWTAVQIRNHRYPILSLEYLNSAGIYQSVARTNYNYFVQPTGMGAGPYTFRVTDVYGHVLVDSGIPSVEDSSVSGHAQFPLCGDSLPIQLAVFTATVLNQHQVRLDWTTLTEIDNYGFDIQRSDTSGQDYQIVPNSFTPGHGTTNAPHNYTWISDVTSGAWYYRLRQTNLDASVQYSEGLRVDMLTGVKEKETPTAFSLGQNYPNPFNPVTNIQFTIVSAQSGSASGGNRQLTIVKVFDVLGREVATLVNEAKEPGRYTVEFDASSLSSGVYFYRLSAGQYVECRKMIVMK